MENFDYIDYPNTLLGKQAPNFQAEIVTKDGQFEKIDFHEYTDGKYAVLFFYPLDFTFVCPSEIIAFSEKMSEFKSRGVELLGCSVDSKFSHFQWRNTPLDKGGIGAINYPLVSDITKEIARKYGVLFDESIAFRATFLIDKSKIVRHITINDLPLGRSTEETLRVIDALQRTEISGEVCPADWKKGGKTMKPTPAGVAEFLGDL
jgi:peroxiredoxin (alkyl hydroperoxide reductase subunit C)